MSLLTIAQDAADVCGIARPSVVIGSTDVNTRRIQTLSNIEGKFLAKRYPWQDLVKEATVTTVATESQGAITTIASDFDRIIDDTQWNRSTQDRIGGPLSPQEWQEQKAITAAGPYYDYRIRGGDLFFYPAPTAGEDARFEYVSKNWCQDTDSNGQDSWAADTDTAIIDEFLITLGTIWRFKKANSLDYGEDYRTYETQVNLAMARDGGKPRLRLDAGSGNHSPSARAPDGSWSV